MHRFLATALLFLYLVARADAADLFPPRLSPSGIRGAVIFVGEKAETKEAAIPFAALTKDAENEVLVISSSEDDGKALHALLEEASVDARVLRSTDKEPLLAALREAPGVWLQDAAVAKDAAVQKELLAARERGAVIAGAPRVVVSLCPGIVNVADDAAPPAGMIGIMVAEDAVGGLHERMLFNQGPGEITLMLAPSPSRAARTVKLSAKQAHDYNELRRAAWGRTQAAFPPVEIGTPEVKSGALVIVGGGGMPKEIAERFVQLGGGAEGHFVVLPTAMPDPLPPGNEGAFLERFGAKHITVIKAREQAALETPENLAALEKATAIWFGGGRQWRFVDAYEGTKVYPLLQDVLKRGGVIGGSSAGATIQGEYLVRGAPAGPHIMMCEGYERGFCFLPGVGIDQHFKQRNRFADMTAFMQTYPQYLGIGLDEATAIIVQGSTAEILGKGEVHFYDRRRETKEGEPDHESFAAGKKYDLQARKVLE